MIRVLATPLCSRTLGWGRVSRRARAGHDDPLGDGEAHPRRAHQPGRPPEGSSSRPADRTRGARTAGSWGRRSPGRARPSRGRPTAIVGCRWRERKHWPSPGEDPLPIHDSIVGVSLTGAWGRSDLAAPPPVPSFRHLREEALRGRRTVCRSSGATGPFAGGLLAAPSPACRQVRRLRRVAAALLAAAALVHAAVIPEHLQEGVVFGAAFVAMSVLQAGLAGALVLHPGPGSTRWVGPPRPGSAVHPGHRPWAGGARARSQCRPSLPPRILCGPRSGVAAHRSGIQASTHQAAGCRWPPPPSTWASPDFHGRSRRSTCSSSQA